MVSRVNIVGYDCGVEYDPDGYYVKYADYAALKAENETLRKALSDQIDRDISGIFPTERALAERAGGVKVKALEWVKHPSINAWRADTMLGTYQVWSGHLGPEWLFDGLSGERINEAVRDQMHAKAAARADYERRILSALITEPAAPKCPQCDFGLGGHEPGCPATPEGRQEAGRIGDAVLDWMVKFDLLDAGNEYYVSDVLAVLNDLTPSTRPAEQAVTEAMVEAAREIIHGARHVYSDEDLARAALEAAMEAGR